MSIKIDVQPRIGLTFRHLACGEFFQLHPTHDFLYLKLSETKAWCFDGRSNEVESTLSTQNADALVRRVTVTSITGKAWE